MPNFYYSNPAFGVGVSNLAEALIGDPERDVRMGLLGDRRRTEQVQRRKLEADALSKEIHNREQEAAYAGINDLVTALTGPMGANARPGAGESLEFALRAGAGSNAQQFANAINILNAMGLAQGDDTQQRQSLVMQGSQPTDNFAGTQARADELIETDIAAKLMQALQVAGVNNAAAMDRTRLQEGGRDRRHTITEQGRDRRATTKATERTPLKVGGSDIEAINEALTTHAKGALGNTHADAVSIDPATESLLVQTIAGLYQNSRNLPLAVSQGWAQVMGQNPAVETSGNWNPFATDSATVRPQDSATIIADARKAIAAGADPAAVRQRLQQMGVDPSAL